MYCQMVGQIPHPSLEVYGTKKALKIKIYCTYLKLLPRGIFYQTSQSSSICSASFSLFSTLWIKWKTFLLKVIFSNPLQKSKSVTLMIPLATGSLGNYSAIINNTNMFIWCLLIISQFRILLFFFLLYGALVVEKEAEFFLWVCVWEREAELICILNYNT